MRIHVIPFGVLKDWLGQSDATFELPDGSSVAELLGRLSKSLPPGAPARILRGIAVSVNTEYAQAAKILHDGDEVGLLPPVSGGAARTEPPRRVDAAHPANVLGEGEKKREIVISLTRGPIGVAQLIAAAKHQEDGALVVFEGIVRNHSRGRRTLHLDYEAYEEMAVRQLWELGRQARERFGVRQVTVIHRLGRLEIGEISVLIVVTSAHRSAAFEACRWLIDRLKQTVPIWKKETFHDGAVWAPGEPFPGELAVDSGESPNEP